MGFSEKGIDGTIKDILNNWQSRPNPLDVYNLIIRGATKETILRVGEETGFAVPILDTTLEEVANMKPYLSQIIEHFADNWNDSQIIFIGRDAEVVYDLYEINRLQTGQTRKGILLPGSVDLWKDGTIGQGEFSKRFLENYGLSKEAICDGPPILLFDTGYRGSVGFFIRQAVERQYGIDADRVKQRLPMRMISVIYVRAHGEQLMEFSVEEDICSRDIFPKVSSVVGDSFSSQESAYYGYDRFAYRLAMSLQLLPHHHGKYDTLVDVGGNVIGVAGLKVGPRINVDTITKEEDGEGRNASIVNPVAALVVQSELIRKYIN